MMEERIARCRAKSRLCEAFLALDAQFEESVSEQILGSESSGWPPRAKLANLRLWREHN